MNDFRKYLDLIEELSEGVDVKLHDSFDIELGEDFIIETGVIGLTEDGIILEADEQTMEFLNHKKFISENEEIDETGMIFGPGQCHEDEELDEYMRMGVSTEPSESVEMDEAEYQGRKVPLNKPMQGDVKKSKVYVRKPNGKVVKVNFGDKNMRIKKSNPNRRKSFRARHRCENPGPKWKARYWSCRAW